MKLTAKEEEKIWAFIRQQTVLNLATTKDGVPWVASCFFALELGHKLLVFKSDKTSRHIEEALSNIEVAGSILPDKLKVGKVRGIQFQGEFQTDGGEILATAKEKYYKKYPYARAVPGDIWTIKLTYVKYTDNTLGFGKKLIWEAERS